MNKNEGGFFSFLDFNLYKSADLGEDYERLYTEVSLLILSWLKEYIEECKPGYDFEDVCETIYKIRLSDNHISFFIKHPYTGVHQQLSFCKDFLQGSQEDMQLVVASLISESRYPQKFHKNNPSQ